MAAIEEAISGERVAAHRVVTFGEAVLRLSAPAHERLERATSLDVAVTGPELNTAAGLVALGVPATWVSSLPESPIGRMIARAAIANGVDTSRLKWVSARTARAGIAFAEHAPSPRPSSIRFDSTGTAMAQVRPGTFDWHAILQGASVLHISGVTLGLSPGVSAEALEAVRIAALKGVLVSFDLSYRDDLWSEADARQAFVKVIREVDVLFASRGTLERFFGIEGSYESVLRQAVEKLGVAAATVSRRRAKGSRRMSLESMAMGKGGTLAVSGSKDIEVVDRLGASDAFAAGFLAGYLENPHGLTRAVSLGAAASALKLTMPGETLCATRDEVEALVADTS
jgi:2-dehydro-3-deoxygluconokinase